MGHQQTGKSEGKEVVARPDVLRHVPKHFGASQVALWLRIPIQPVGAGSHHPMYWGKCFGDKGQFFCHPKCGYVAPYGGGTTAFRGKAQYVLAQRGVAVNIMEQQGGSSKQLEIPRVQLKFGR